MEKFTKRTSIVQAEQVTTQLIRENDVDVREVAYDEENGILYSISVHGEGEVHVNLGDWVIIDNANGVSVLSNEGFNQLYVKIGDSDDEQIY